MAEVHDLTAALATFLGLRVASTARDFALRLRCLLSDRSREQTAVPIVEQTRKATALQRAAIDQVGVLARRPDHPESAISAVVDCDRALNSEIMSLSQVQQSGLAARVAGPPLILSRKAAMFNACDCFQIRERVRMSRTTLCPGTRSVVRLCFRGVWEGLPDDCRMTISGRGF